MPGDEDHAIADQFASQCDRLIGIAEIIADDQLDVLPEHAAPGIEIRDRQLGAALMLLAEPSVRAGHRAGRADPDLGARRRSHESA